MPNDAELALAEVHAELILAHQFFDGNGRLARLLALLMTLQALAFLPLANRALMPSTAKDDCAETPNAAATSCGTTG